MNRSWYWRWHGRRCFGPAHRSRRFGLWSWHHFADDSVGPKPRIVRVDGKECSDQSLPRYKENTVQLTHITPESAKRLFHPPQGPLSLLHPSLGQDKAQSHHGVDVSTV